MKRKNCGLLVTYTYIRRYIYIYGRIWVDRFSFFFVSFSFSLSLCLLVINEGSIDGYIVGCTRRFFLDELYIYFFPCSLFCLILYKRCLWKRGGKHLKIFTSSLCKDDGADNVFLLTMLAFSLASAVHLLDKIEKSALVLERIRPRKKEEEEGKKPYSSYISIHDYQSLLERKRKIDFLVCTIATTLLFYSIHVHILPYEGKHRCVVKEKKKTKNIWHYHPNWEKRTDIFDWRISKYTKKV